MTAWAHQTELVRSTLSAIDSGVRRVCFQSPTGSGKTRMERMIIDHFRKLNKRILILAHKRNLIRNIGKELRASENNFSYVMPGYPMLNCKIQIGSIQTVINRYEGMTSPDIILVDEFHHAVSPSYMKLINHFNEAIIIGGTATPGRRDKKPMRLTCDKIIMGPQPKELIKLNILSDYDYYQPKEISAEGLKKTRDGSEFIYDEVAEKRIDQKYITGNAIEHYKKYADHQPTIIACISIKHAEHVAAQFREAGYRAYAIHSKLDDSEIDRLEKGFVTGVVEILCQCDLLGEGVDIPGAICYIWLRWTESLIIFLQGCGRVLRYMLGKRAVIIDAVGNSGRHGYPDDERIWGLDGVTNVDKGRLLYKRCDSCFNGRVPRSASSCPFCGAAFDMSKSEGRALPQEEEGELVNVRASKVELIDFELVSESFEEHKKITISQIAAQAKTFEQAKTIARARGYENQRFAFYVWTKILKRRIERRAS
jgi:DNA repair protein RadD